MKVAEIGVEMGNEWGNLWESVSQSTSENRRLGSRRAHFTQERITMPDYLSRVIKAVLPNSIITHLEENRQEEIEKEEEEEQLSSHPLCYCEPVDPPDGIFGGVRSSLELIWNTKTSPAHTEESFHVVCVKG